MNTKEQENLHALSETAEGIQIALETRDIGLFEIHFESLWSCVTFIETGREAPNAPKLREKALPKRVVDRIFELASRIIDHHASYLAEVPRKWPQKLREMTANSMLTQAREIIKIILPLTNRLP